MHALEHVVVLGGGAMGCLFGGFLQKAKCRVTLIDTHSETVEAIAGRGIVIVDAGSERQITGVAATLDYTAVRDADLVLVLVKSGATAKAVKAAAPFLSEGVLMLTLQNGLGNVEKLCGSVGAANVVAGTTGSGATTLGPGHVRLAGIAETVIGELDGSLSDRIALVRDLFILAGLPTRVTSSINSVLWTKLLANAGINAIAALTGLRNGEIPECSEAAALMEAAVMEAAAVAKASGVFLNVDDPVAYVRHVAAMTAGNDASMLQDVRKKRATEIDAINGEIVRRGEALNVPTQVNAMLASLVRLREAGYANL